MISADNSWEVPRNTRRIGRREPSWAEVALFGQWPLRLEIANPSTRFPGDLSSTEAHSFFDCHSLVLDLIFPPITSPLSIASTADDSGVIRSASATNGWHSVFARECRYILGMRVDVTSYPTATAQVLAWAKSGESRYICEAPVAMVMEAYDDPEYQAMINGADLVTPGGMPIVWMMRRLGVRAQPRVYGPELTLHVCRAAAEAGIPVGFYGGTPQALCHLVDRMKRRFPGLRICYSSSPPFRAATADEKESTTRDLLGAGCRILFVGLGCPKQERWMAEHRTSLPMVMLGVGAAFDFLSGEKPQAPPWMQRLGLEWLFRLAVEPRRLWFRYLYHNPRFVLLATAQLLRAAQQSRRDRKGVHGGSRQANESK